MDPINIFLAIIILGNLLFVVASVGYQKNAEKGSEKSLIYKLYLVNIATIVWWLASTVFFRIASPNNIFFYTKNMYVSATLIASSFYYFSYIFPEYKSFHIRRLVSVLFVNAAVVCLIIFSDGIIMGGVDNINGENVAILGKYFLVYAAYILYYFCTSFARLFSKYKAELEPTARAQLFYVFIGYTVSGVVAFIADLGLPFFGQFGYLWVGPAATVCVASFIIYAAKRHSLFSMKIVAVEIFVFALWIFAILKISIFSESPQPPIDVLYLIITIMLGALFVGSVKRELVQRERNEMLVAKLKEADELKTKFLSLATHQMASPLTAMKVYSSLIKEGGTMGERLSQPKEGGIERIADSFISIVKDFLDISKLEFGEEKFSYEDVAIAETINVAVSSCATKAEAKNVEVKIILPWLGAGNLNVRADREKLKQAFQNILENSIKYSKDGGIIKVAADEENGIVKIIFADEGERVLPTTAFALLGKFSSSGNQAEADVVGNSLGLYAAKQAIEGMGGKFFVNVGEFGACNFNIYLERSNL